MSQLFASGGQSIGVSASTSVLPMGGIICISEVIDISPSNLDYRLRFLQPSVSHNVHKLISRVTIIALYQYPIKGLPWWSSG